MVENHQFAKHEAELSYVRVYLGGEKKDRWGMKVNAVSPEDKSPLLRQSLPGVSAWCSLCWDIRKL